MRGVGEVLQMSSVETDVEYGLSQGPQTETPRWAAKMSHGAESKKSPCHFDMKHVRTFVLLFSNYMDFTFSSSQFCWKCVMEIARV